jgi:hypothetical protein
MAKKPLKKQAPELFLEPESDEHFAINNAKGRTFSQAIGSADKLLNSLLCSRNSLSLLAADTLNTVSVSRFPLNRQQSWLLRV